MIVAMNRIAIIGVGFAGMTAAYERVGFKI